MEHNPSFYRKLTQETEVWVRDGLITSEQKGKILARYEHLQEAEEKAGSGRLITTITILGSILIGTGILLFIASNWSEIPRWGKLGIIFISMAVAYGLGFYLRYERGNYPKAGASLILLGSFIFGAGIFLIAQIYHIAVHYPNGPLLWGLGVLPLAYLLGFRSILTLAIIDILVWLGMESSFHMTLTYAEPVAFILLYLMTGISLWSVGLMHSGFIPIRKLSVPYIIAGVFLTFFGGYFMTFDVFRERLGSEGLIVFYAGIIFLFLISAIIYLIWGEKKRGWIPEFSSMVFLLILSVVFLLLQGGDSSGLRYETTNLLTLSSNIVFALEIIGIIILGYIRRDTVYINIGLFFFVLDIIARYFDFFWKLLPRSIFFIIGGAMLLLGGVFLEKKRRNILKSFHIEEAA